jgi:glycosyltransferase involved in cell wall biosynthesis
MISSSTKSHAEQNRHLVSLKPRKARVSIIIPTYNHAQYVVDAIQSVLNQVYDNYEIIVIDDGSQDNTRQVVAQFGNQVRYIWQENQGLSAARNTGLRAARGEIIGLLDADDLYDPNFLSTLVSILEANPEADAVYCAARAVDATNNLLPQSIGRVVPSSQLYNTLINGNFLVPLCMVAYQSCYDKVGLFDKRLQGCADWDMWLRIAKKCTVIGTNEILARYRIVPQSMSSDHKHMFNDRMAVLQKHFGITASDLSHLTPVQRQAYSRAYLTTAVEYLQRHELDQASRCLRKMLEFSPDLVTRLDVFYELGCGDQAKGFRGDFSTLNVHQNASVLLEMLEKLFHDPSLLPDVIGYRRVAFANAYLALGLLFYGTRQFRAARGFLLRALATNPRHAFNRQLLLPLAKSLLDARLIDWLGRGYREAFS